MMNRILDWVAAALVMGALACAGASPIPQCATDDECAALCPADDAECDGGPYPAAYLRTLECNRYDCGEG